MGDDEPVVACSPLFIEDNVGPPPYTFIMEPSEVLKPFLSMVNETHANMTIDEYLVLCRGDRHLKAKVIYPVTIIYALIFLTGIIGNSLVCIVVKQNKSMWTVTNFYLLSLAASDLVLLVLGLPNDLILFWEQYPYMFGEAFCKLRAFISEMSSYSSVLVIVAFSGERYLAVCHPLHSHQISTLPRAKFLIAAAWITSFCASVPFAYYTSINYIDFPPNSSRLIMDSAFCAMLKENVPASYYIYVISFVLFFVIPLGFIVFMYWQIGAKLRRREADSLRRQNRSHQRSKKATIRMLGAVVIAFFLCWAPFHLQRLFYLHMTFLDDYPSINEKLYYVAGYFYFFSATVNPVLYSLMSKKFREAFKRTLLCNFRVTGLGRNSAQIPTSEPVRAVVRTSTKNGNTSVSLEQAIPGLQSRVKETYI